MFKNFLKTLFVSTLLIGLLFGISKADVQNIRMDYCENVGKRTPESSRLINLNSGEQKEICLNFSSKETEEVKVIYGFTEALFNSRGTQVCQANMDVPNSFNKLRSNDNGNVRSFFLKPGETKVIIEKLNVPAGMSGMNYGCFMHKIATVKSNKMFTVVVVIKRILNVFVTK